MKSKFISYECRKCNKETLLINTEVKDTLDNGGYISCSHCGSRNIREEDSTESFKECMDHAAYKRKKGAIRQVHSG